LTNNTQTLETTRYIGLMSGTSLDGADAALVSFTPTGAARLEGQVYLPFPDELRQQLLALNSPGDNEIERSCIQANRLSRLYAESVAALLQQSGLATSDIIAIGSHGQTIRHRPEFGFTVQIGNSALLAELSDITVISDFRSRDIASGGQGAPLVPAFHHAVFFHPAIHRVIVNIGGISNLTYLPPNNNISGFDCGPANLLMDAWAQRHLGRSYDKNGEWAASGQVIEGLLTALLGHPFFWQRPPKSTGRDTFNIPWLEQYLKAEYQPADVQATLLELAARGIADAIQQYCQDATEIFLCGGGARNLALRSRLQELCGVRKIALTDDLGIGVDWVEAAAFAWLAKQTMEKLPSNLPAVTGAQGPRILGAIYPA
jgi:anhydro-N-acetylmuramic acid kinase